ncbi:MAG TPA: hypothetical protein VMV77_19820 [Bacteroidales bacterium]|nr:hypothetical protein [Bacteroidales bacterium]
MKRYEAVAGLGPALFFGDVGGFSKTKNILGLRDMSFLQTRFDLNLNFKYRITQDINIRLSLSYGFLHATDKRGSNEARGYEASTSIFEPALIGEYYFIKNKAENSYLFSSGEGNGFQWLFKSLDFYVFTGIGGLNYSVKGNDALVNTGIESGGFTAVIPVGVGSTLIYSPDFNFGVEFGGRYSFSDNLDGYTSQYSSSNDVYYFFNFTVTYKLKTGANGLPSFR